MSKETHKAAKQKKYSQRDAINFIHDYGLDIDRGEIFLFGHEDYIGENDLDGSEPGVEFAMANQFIRNLSILRNHGEKPILIHMKTCGGEWAEGMAIYDAIASCPNQITILNYTHARSMSSLIFQAADRRVMMPHSTFMIHRGTTAFTGTVTQFETEATQGKKADKIMLDIYIDVMRDGCYVEKSRTWLEKWLRKKMRNHEEVYFTADEAISFGFADEIFGDSGVYDWESLKK